MSGHEGTAPRIKICGLMREQDVTLAVECGAKLLGFIAVPTSPRALTIERVAELTAAVPSGVACVLVVRDESAATLRAWCEQAPRVTHLQLHGEEPAELVAATRAATTRAIIKAVPVAPDGSMMLLDTGADFDLLDTRVGGTAVQAASPLTRDGQTSTHAGSASIEAEPSSRSASGGHGLEGHAATFGGSGRTFDWSVLAAIDAPTRASRIMLAGGITPDNIAEAARTGVFALDLASGVEVPGQPGIKDHGRVRALFTALNEACRNDSVADG